MDCVTNSVFSKRVFIRWFFLVLIVTFLLLAVWNFTHGDPVFFSVDMPPTKIPQLAATLKYNGGLSNVTKQFLSRMDIENSVPKIVHFCWYGGGRKSNFRFHHFIGVLAAHKFIKPKKIMFWYEQPPTGDYWKQILLKVQNIEMVYRKAPTSIYGKSVRVPEHQSDVVRLEAVMRHGGIYLDLDVIALKSFDPLLKYDVTMGLQSKDGLCNGAIIAKPGAEFLKIWHEEYRSFSDGNWAYHSVYLPFKLYEKHKDLVHVEERSIHRPSWFETAWIYKEGQIYDWSQNYAMHLWYRKFNKDMTPQSIQKLNSTLGQIFRYIYYGSPDFV